MKISLNWLQDFIEITESDHEKIKDLVTERIAEVETLEKQGEHLENVIVGKITEIKDHPNADKLKLTTVSDGSESYKVVCGGSNLEEGMLVAYAKVGAVVKWHGTDIMKLEKIKLRGEESYGMVCTSAEVSIEELFPQKYDHEIVDFTALNFKEGTPLAEALNLNDSVLDVDNHAITNRGDLFSHSGFAREMVAIGVGKWKKKKEFKVPENNSPIPIDINIECKDVCSRYMGVYLTGIEIGESPEWIKQRLSACGIRPISNIVDITNYVMLETGMPTHAFDLDQITGKKWTMRKSKKGEKVVTLDEQQHELFEDVIIFDDNSEIFDLCGIMGGFNSGVNSKTNKVWLHSPVYHPTMIRKAMRGLGHISDAGIIYEKKVDDELAQVGLERCIELILEICPNAKVGSKIMDERNIKPETRVLNLRNSQVTRLMGVELPSKEIEKILNDLGFETKGNKEEYEVTVPSWRLADTNIEADLIEEIARVYGYNNIPSEMPKMDITPIPIPKKRVFEREMKEKLTSFGFNEIYTFAFQGPELEEKSGLIPDKEGTIEIENPISSDMSLMRTSLLPRMLETVESNLRYKNTFRLFEISKTYHRMGASEHVERDGMILATVNEEFRELEGVMEALGFTIIPSKEPMPIHHPGRSADLILRGKNIGHLAEVHPKILKNFDIKTRVVVAVISLEVIHEMNIDNRPSYKEINKYPSIKLDISISIPEKNLAIDYMKCIQNTDKKLITNIELIDEYSGDKMEKGKRALTYSITYQASDRTLTEEEVSAVHKQVLDKLTKNGAVIR